MMRKTVLNYKIVIEKEKAAVYTVYCPALGLADWGKTIDQAMKRIRNLIVFHIESLKQLQEEIPVEQETTAIVTSIGIPINGDFRFSYV